MNTVPDYESGTVIQHCNGRLAENHIFGDAKICKPSLSLQCELCHQYVTVF